MRGAGQREPAAHHAVRRAHGRRGGVAIVQDPATAEALAAIDHPYAAKRPPIDSDYFATFNRPNVALVDPSTKKPTRVGRRVEEQTKDGVKRTVRVRFAKKSGKDL